MAELLANRWIQLAAVGVITTLLAAAGSAVIFSGGSAGTALGPVKLTTGGSVLPHGGSRTDPRFNVAVDEDLPLTAAEAVAAGWEDPILCSTGRGRYFQKTGGEEIPYLLMYDAADELIGIYQTSETEMPPPWEFTQEIYGGGGPVLDYQHWGLFVYFRDPLQACTTTQGGCGYALCR